MRDWLLHLPHSKTLWIAAATLVMSLFTFAAYALDKSAARNARPRTPERTLHLLSLVGGWPGGLVAQQTLRHKNRKTSFLALFWLTALLHLAAITAILIR